MEMSGEDLKKTKKKRKHKGKNSGVLRKGGRGHGGLLGLRLGLRARFLIIPAVLLLVGDICLIFFTAYSLDKSISTNAVDRLLVTRSHIQERVGQQETFLISQATSLALIPFVGQALLEDDSAVLKPYVGDLVDKLRLSSGFSTLNLVFYHPPGVEFVRSSSLMGAETINSDGSLAARAAKQNASFAGLTRGGDGPVLTAVAPVHQGEQHVGEVSASVSLAELLGKIPLPFEGGLALTGPLGDESGEAPGAMAAEALASGSEVPRQVLARLSGGGSAEGVQGDFAYALLNLRDIGGASVAGVILTSDISGLNRGLVDRVLQFAIFFTAGAIFLWLILFWNVSRIETFLARLKTIIMSFHSNYFSERFESDHVHCLDVLHCHNEECPVYQNPTLVCYLETGSEAISPRWRDTCVYLNAYDSCRNCPVYALRKGDELTEMRNVVNTMMRLWSDFLSRVGQLIGYVMRTQGQLSHAPSLDDISAQLEQMAKLTFFSHDLQGVLEKDEVYKQLAYVFDKQLGLSRFILFEVDQDRDRILIALDHATDEPLCKRRILLSSQLCRACRVAEDVVSYYNPELCPHFNINSSEDVRVCMPVVMGGQVGAVFTFIMPRREFDRTRHVMPVLRKYLDETAPVLSSLRLLALTKDQALTDPLTHCHNRRFLDEYIRKYEPLAERESRRNGFLMADLDFFKQVNDQHGHEAGDAVLRQVVQIIQDSIRRSDLCVRYGGEEFLVLLHSVDEDVSVEIAEKIRTSVEQHDFELPGSQQTIKKTISIGVSETPEDATRLYQAIKFADVALYECKKAGRNKVMRFKPEMWGEQFY